MPASCGQFASSPKSRLRREESGLFTSWKLKVQHVTLDGSSFSRRRGVRLGRTCLVLLPRFTRQRILRTAREQIELRTLEATAFS